MRWSSGPELVVVVPDGEALMIGRLHATCADNPALAVAHCTLRTAEPDMPAGAAAPSHQGGGS